MKLGNFVRSALAALSLFAIGGDVSHAQSANPFNPDFAWCATPGSIATRNATPPLWGCLTPGTAGQVLRTNGPGANVSWQTISGTGTVTSVGLALPSFMTVSGSPVTTTGTLTGTLASQTANQLFVAPNGVAGAPTFRSMLAADMPNAGVATGGNVTGTWPSLSISAAATGGVITGTYPAITVGSGQITNAMLAGSISNSNLATMATKTIKSNVTGATAAPADNTITAVLDAQLGTTQGAIAYRDGTQWTALAPSAGNILQSNGAGANPSWVSPSAAIPASVGIGHRLTFQTGTPVMSGNVSAATTVYSTPYQSGLLLLWNGTSYVPTNCAETSQLLTDTTKSPAAAVANGVYDMFAWNDAGTCRVTRGPAWTNGTTRSAGTALSRANGGILSNSVSITNGPAAGYGLYMGTIMTDSAGATVSYLSNGSGTVCSLNRVGVWNYYNRVDFQTVNVATQTAHSNGSTTWTGYGATTNCQTTYVSGLAEDTYAGEASTNMGFNTAVNGAGIGIAWNNGTAPNNQPILPFLAINTRGMAYGRFQSPPTLGVGYMLTMERGDGTNLVNFNDLTSFQMLVTGRY